MVTFTCNFNTDSTDLNCPGASLVFPSVKQASPTDGYVTLPMEGGLRYVAPTNGFASIERVTVSAIMFLTTGDYLDVITGNYARVDGVFTEFGTDAKFGSTGANVATVTATGYTSVQTPVSQTVLTSVELQYLAYTF